MSVVVNVLVNVPNHRIRLVPFFADLVHEHHGDFDSILDLGCGVLQKIWHQRWGNRYEGFDNRDTVGADYIGDACDLSRFESNSRDVITSWSTIEHVKHPYMMLEEMIRVSNGTVIITTDSTQHDKDGDPSHIYSWTLKTFKQLLTLAHVDNKVYLCSINKPNDIMVGVIYNCK